MSFTNAQQLYELFLYTGAGFLLCLYNDLFRIWRRIRRPKRWVLIAQDLFLCVSSTLLLFLFALTVNGAEIRFAMLVCGIGGFVAARMTVSRLLMLFADALICLCRRLYAAVRDLLRPLYRRCVKAAQRLGRFLREKGRFVTKKVLLFSKKDLPDKGDVVYNQSQQ